MAKWHAQIVKWHPQIANTHIEKMEFREMNGIWGGMGFVRFCPQS